MLYGQEENYRIATYHKINILNFLTVEKNDFGQRKFIVLVFLSKKGQKIIKKR